METPLLKHSGGHTGAAPTISFEWIACGWWYRLGGLRVGGWCRLGRLCVNGYFVCVGCVEKYDGDG